MPTPAVVVVEPSIMKPACATGASKPKASATALAAPFSRQAATPGPAVVLLQLALPRARVISLAATQAPRHPGTQRFVVDGTVRLVHFNGPSRINQKT